MPTRNATPAMMNGRYSYHDWSSPVLREYQMNRTENTRATTATIRSRASRGVCSGRLSASAT